MDRSATTTKFIASGMLFFLLAASCLPSSQTRQQVDLEHSCRDFVQKFYDWYVPKALDLNVPDAPGVALNSRNSDFSPELVKLLKEDSEAQAKHPNEIVGLDFDPFLSSRDPSDHFVARTITLKSGNYFVEVYGISSGERREKVVAELALKKGQWLFVNFHYSKSGQAPAKNDDLLSCLKRLRENRRQHAK
jgi:hypothetical protein